MSRKQPNPAPRIPVRYGEESDRSPFPGPRESVRDVQVNGHCAMLIVWHPVATDPPLDGVVVLIVGDDGYAWVGFKGADTWYDATDNRPMAAPRWWCHFPEAPQ